MNLREFYEDCKAWLNADQALYPRPPRSHLADWLRQCCIYGDAAAGQRELMKDLHDNYLDWCRITGAPENERMSVRMLGLALSQRQIRTAGKNARGMQYRGPIRLRSRLPVEAVAISHPSEGQDAKNLHSPAHCAAREYPRDPDAIHQGQIQKGEGQVCPQLEPATPPSPVPSDPPPPDSDALRSQLPSPPLTPAAFVAAVRALLALTEHPATASKPWKGVEQ